MLKILIISLVCLSTNAIADSIIQRIVGYYETIGQLDSRLIFEDHQTGLKGIKNYCGQVIIPPSYKQILSWGREDIIYVLNDNNDWFLKDFNTKTSRHMMTYDNGPDYFHLGLARYLDHQKIGFVSQNGDIIISARYDFALPFDFNAPVTIVGQKFQKLTRTSVIVVTVMLKSSVKTMEPSIQQGALLCP